MSGKSIYFSSYSEIERRTSFNSEQEISPDNFQSLVGMYHFDEEVVCQVRTKKGICRQKHKTGWLGITNQGVEALIGGHCASGYFKADNAFILERKRVKSEIERRDNIEKLREYILGDRDYPGEVAGLRAKLISLRKIIDSCYKSLPNVVLKFIDDAQRTQNWVINVDIGSAEVREITDENGQIRYENFYKWTPGNIGRLSQIPPRRDIFSLITKVDELAKAYGEVCGQVIDEIATPKMKNYVKRLAEKDDFNELFSKYEAQAKAFIKPGNLDSLLYVCDNEEERFLTVKSTLAITGSKVSSEGHIRLRMRRIVERYEKLFNGNKVRKNQILSIKSRQF